MPAELAHEKVQLIHNFSFFAAALSLSRIIRVYCCADQYATPCTVGTAKEEIVASNPMIYGPRHGAEWPATGRGNRDQGWWVEYT